MTEQTKYFLPENELPEAWYNINADMPISPGPVLHPGTKEPVTPEFLSALFPMRFIQEAVSEERRIEIPEPVREIYKLWRPAPLIPRPSVGEIPRHPGTHLLQIRRRIPSRIPQTKHRYPSSLLCIRGRDCWIYNRNGRGAMGICAWQWHAISSILLAMSIW